MRRAVSIVEVLVLIVIASGLLIPLLTLSGRNVEDHQDQLERALAQGLCLDMLERFKRFKPYWTFPGAEGGGPLDEMFGPVELKTGQATLFDFVYLENMRALGMKPQPKIERTPDPTHYGLFKLDVSVSWKSAKGRERSVKYSRWCYAP
jgi:hypothetical protein